MSAFEKIPSHSFDSYYPPVTTPPHADSDSSVTTVWDRFQQLCAKEADRAIYLHMTTFIRFEKCYSRAITKELKVKFTVDTAEETREGKIDKTFHLALKPQFKAVPPMLVVQIEKKEWGFEIKEMEDDNGNIGLQLLPKYDDPIIDDITETYHLINGKYELLLHPFFVGDDINPD